MSVNTMEQLGSKTSDPDICTLSNKTLYISSNADNINHTHILRKLANIGIYEPEYISSTIMSENTHPDIVRTMNHMRCLEIARQRKYPFVFICEHTFNCIHPIKFIAGLTSICRCIDKTPHSILGNWNVIILGGNNAPPYYSVDGIDNLVEVSCCTSSVGYIVNEIAYSSLIENYKQGIELYADGVIQHPTCNLVKMQGKNSGWYLLVPLTITRTEYGEQKMAVHHDRWMLDLDKDWLMSPMHAQQIKQPIHLI